jgi:hypothetical protein
MPTLRNGFLACAALYAGLTLAYMLYNSFTNPLGSIDFHSYWYAAHFLRAGRDPYEAYFIEATPAPPIRYLDGITVNDDPAQPNLQKVPANTAPLLLLLSPLAWLSWLPAKTIWLAINTVLMLIAPWLTFKVGEQYGITVNRWGQAAVAIAFFAISAPRFVVGYGQTSLIVYDLMMGALLLMHSHPIIAGLLFGAALSKYSIVFPVALLFAYWRQGRMLVVAGVVQVVGVVTIVLIGGNNPIEVLEFYARYAIGHADISGIHMASLFPGVVGWVNYVTPFILTFVVGYFLVKQGWLRRALPDGATVTDGRVKFSLIVIGLLWGVLVVYHRMYDGLLILPFFLLIAWGVARLPTPQNHWLSWYGIAVVTIMSLPVPLYEWIFSNYWWRILNAVWTLIFCSAIAVTFRLMQVTSDK